MRITNKLYRIEHHDEVDSWLVNRLEYTGPRICMGPWSLSGNYKAEDLMQIARLGTRRMYPRPVGDKKYDEEIYRLTEELHLKFVFGCRTSSNLFRYFTPKTVKMLAKYGFVMKVYESNHVVHSQYQSAMDVTKPFNLVSQFSLPV